MVKTYGPYLLIMPTLLPVIWGTTSQQLTRLLTCWSINSILPKLFQSFFLDLYRLSCRQILTHSQFCSFIRSQRAAKANSIQMNYNNSQEAIYQIDLSYIPLPIFPVTLEFISFYAQLNLSSKLHTDGTLTFRVHIINAFTYNLLFLHHFSAFPILFLRM